MRHRLLPTAAILLLSAGSLSAQSLSSSLGWNTFVEGLSPVMNTITLNNPPQEVARVSFDLDGTRATTLVDSTRDDGFTVRFDMGAIHADPNARIRIICFNAAGVPIDTIGHMIQVIPTPYWMHSSTISNLAVTADSITFDVSYPLGGDRYAPVADGLFGERAIGIQNAALGFHVGYDYRREHAIATEVQRKATLDLFGRAQRGMTLPLSLGAAEFDSKLNLHLNGNQQGWDQEFLLDYTHIPLKIDRFPEMRIDAGVIAQGYMSMSANMGRIGTRSGSLRDEDGYTVTAASVHGLGFQRGAIQSQLSGVPMVGSLALEALISAQTVYVALPTEHTDMGYGGNLRVSGQVQAKPFWQFQAGRSDRAMMQGMDYKPIGDEAKFGNISGTLAVTTLAQILDDHYQLPTSWPQPHLDGNAGHMNAVWIETGTPRGRLLLSTLNANWGAFSAPHEVVANSNSIGSPTLKVTADGSALIAWTQSRYDASTAPTDLSVTALARSEDVWYAWYDAVNDQLTPPMRMADDTTGVETGRADGTPAICLLGPDTCMVAWSGLDPDGLNSLWYSIVTRSNGNLTATAPARISVPGGSIQTPTLLARPNGGVLLTVMVSPQSESNNNMTQSSWLWNGSQWKSTSSPTYKQTALTEMDGATAGDYGVIGLLARERVGSSYHPAVIIHGWNADQSPMADPYADLAIDSTMEAGEITANVQSSGLAVISFQQFPKSNGGQPTTNQGHRVFYIRDLSVSGQEWKRVDPVLNDTSAYVWDATSGMINNGEYYLITQEDGADGPNLHPVGGSLFYLPEPQLVLRRAMISASGTVVAETPTGVDDAKGRDVMQQLNGASIAVIPNPVMGASEMLFNLPGTGAMRVELFDIQGRRIALLADQQMSAGPHSMPLPTQGLTAGTYIVRINLEGIIRSCVVSVFNE